VHSSICRRDSKDTRRNASEQLLDNEDLARRETRIDDSWAGAIFSVNHSELRDRSVRLSVAGDQLQPECSIGVQRLLKDELSNIDQRSRPDRDEGCRTAFQDDSDELVNIRAGRPTFEDNGVALARPQAMRIVA
jgi:hypothetical protein